MANPTGAPRTLLPTAGAISILLPLWRQDLRYLCICVFAFVYWCICIYIWRSRRTSIWTSAPPNLPLLPNHSPWAVSRALTPFIWICESNIIYSTQLQDFLNSGQINFPSILRVLLERCRDKWKPMKKRLEKLLRKLWSKITLFLIWSDWRLRAPCGGERWWCLLYRFCIRSTLLKCITRLKIVYHHISLSKLLYYYLNQGSAHCVQVST